MAGGGGDGDKSGTSILWVVAAIFVIGALIWNFFQIPLKTFFLNLRLYEAQLIGFFIEDGNIIAESILQTDVFTLDLAWAKVLSESVGVYLRYPLILMMILMILFLFMTHASLRFGKVYDMTSLAKQEKGNWPQISPVVPLDLIGSDIHKGPWAMAMTPMQFAKQYKLISVEMIPDKKSPWKAQGSHKAMVNKERAIRVFVSQLGAQWQGIDQLAPHVQALFAAFAARVEHDSTAAAGIIAQLSISAAEGKINYTGVTKLLRQYIKSKAVQRCVTRHAYVYTVMASMLELARTDGVFATADFLWLRPIDRKLWYTLNCVGRQVAFSEIAGIYAHWLAEKEMGRPLYSPMVEEALLGLELAMERTVYMPVEDEALPMAGDNNG